MNKQSLLSRRQTRKQVKVRQGDECSDRVCTAGGSAEQGHLTQPVWGRSQEVIFSLLISTRFLGSRAWMKEDLVWISSPCVVTSLLLSPHSPSAPSLSCSCCLWVSGYGCRVHDSSGNKLSLPHTWRMGWAKPRMIRLHLQSLLG